MLNVIQKYELTCIFHSPPIYLLFTQPGFPREKLKSIRYAMSGSAPLSKDLQQRATKVFYNGTKLATNWGMTEVVAVATVYPAGKEQLDGSVGMLLPGMQAKIIDTITGKELDVGERGELLIKGFSLRVKLTIGPNVTIGYYKNPEQNEAAIEGDWLHTGDIAIFDSNHHLFIVDRLKELIKYKGNQVAPAELEGLLISHPSIADAAVIGFPGEEGNELPRAYVVKKDSNLKAKEVQEWIAERVSTYKKLRGGVFFVESIPKSPSGKILRRQLKDVALQEAKESKL
jgi:4-coumarate--CoA ligase